jgi:plastocyanin
MKRKIVMIVALVASVGCLAVSVFPQGAALGNRNSAQGGGKTANVRVKNLEFQPKTITVKPGTTVIWTNDEGSHTINADNGSFSSPTLTAGQTFSRKFARKGTYRYYCSFHGGAGGHDMAGTVIVKP